MFQVQVSYVLGFAFSYDAQHVLLMQKSRPAWQAGKLNGIGGKIEKEETSFEAMVREFAEETDVKQEEWSYVGKRFREAIYDKQPHSYEMFIYATWLPFEKMQLATQHISDEKVICMPLNLEIIRQIGVPGLAWTVDSALCSLTEGFSISVQDPSVLT